MKNIFALLSLLLVLTGSVPVSLAWLPHHPSAARPTAAVYVCMSKGSIAYHSGDRCPGLNRCNHEVRGMSTADAQSLGKRACMKCY